MATQNVLQLEAARAMPAPYRFNYDAIPSLSRWTYPLPYYSVLLLIRYLTLWPWPLTFDLEHLQRIVCDMMKLCTKFERNRAIPLRVVLGSEIIFTKFDLRQLIRAWIMAFFDDGRVCHAVTLKFDPLTLKVRGTSNVTWSNCVRNLSEIEQSQLKWIIDNFANFLHMP